MLVSLALMLVDHRYHQLEAVRSVLSVMLSPLQFVVNLPRTASDWASETLATRSRLQQENRQLRRENLRLQANQQKLDAVSAENRRLRNLLDSSFKIGDRVLIAELIGVDLDPYRQQVLINKGERSGIYLGQPVLDASAVMGQVIHLSRYSSTVLLITDASHSLPVQVNRNGLRSVATGIGRINTLRLQHLPNNADIQTGDLLVTSGLGGRFPPGYPVAAVCRCRGGREQSRDGGAAVTPTVSRGGLVILFTFVIALLLTLLPLPGWADDYRPQWYTLVLIYWALATPHKVGVGVGWLIGVAVDVITGTLFGQHALGLSLVAFVTLKVHQRVRLFPLWQQAVTVLLLLLLEKLVSLWVVGAIAQPMPGLWFWAPPLVGMVLWPWVYIVLRDLRRKFQVA